MRETLRFGKQQIKRRSSTLGVVREIEPRPDSSGLPPPFGVERRFSVVTASGALLDTGYFLPASPG